MAPFTGGSPRTTGIWYDDVWDWTWYAPGSDCNGPVETEVQYAENIDYNSSLLWSGGIDPSQLPMAKINGTCTAVYPHQRLQVNTVFEVVRAAGLQTAYTDKHPAYDLVRGPSGTGLTTGYFPEIAATPNNVNGTIKYDSLHVQAWLDWIDGITPVNSTYGSLTTGQMPALMGGNFQCVSVAQKTVGYNPDLSFSSNLTQALDFVDASIGQVVSKLKAKSLLDDTLIIIASKHGQNPIDKRLLKKIDPEAVTNATGVPTAFVTTDDIALIWLNKTSDISAAAANLNAKASSLAIQEVIYGQALIDQGFGDPSKSARVPHIIVRPNVGVIYTTGSKVAEHGGLSDDDRHITCLVSNPKLPKQAIAAQVATRQIGPSILQALNLDPKALQAVVSEGTAVLPGLFAH